MLILSHRGYHIGAPENTPKAFELALRLGVDGFETDVRLSADGLPILFHDRVTPDGREVASVTRKELSEIVGFEVPLLGEMIKRWPDVFWNVEIKSRDVVTAVIPALSDHAKSTRLLISSFWHPAVEEVCGRLDISGGMLIAHCPLDLNSLLNNVGVGGRINTLVWDYETVDDELIQRAALNGMHNYVYGAITMDEHLRLLNLPIVGVITDYPEHLR